MLGYRLLKNPAGILLIGDYTSLKGLYEIVHDVDERSPLTKTKDDSFLGLAYDVRHAFEGQRQVINPPSGFEKIGIRYGVEIIWPEILLQQRMLRASLAFIDHSRMHQAITYALEAVIEDALHEDFEADGRPAVQLWQRINPAEPNTFEKLESRAAIYSSWTKAERKRHFLNLLDSFSSMYESIYEARKRNGESGLLDPKELDRWKDAERPDPKW